MSGRVLLVTGGAGAAGRGILARLAGDRAFARIAILTHTTPVDQATAGDVVRGDVTRQDLGMDAPRAAALARDVTDVLHMAADTRFGAPLDTLRAVNVAGVERVLAFARRCPRLQRIVALSTLYVAGRRTGTIREDDLAHTAGFVNAYEESKYEAEAALRAAMATLPIAIARLSTIIGSAQDGSVGRPAAIHHALRFYYQSLAPMLPGTSSSPVDLIPLEYAADAVGTLIARAFAPGTTWHIAAARDAPPLDALLDLTLGAFLKYRPSWRRRAIEKPVVVPLRTFERFADSVEELGNSVLSRCVGVVRPFAPQLAYPKTFDDRVARAALDAHGVQRPTFASYYPSIIRHLIEEHWSVAGETAVIA